MLLGFDKGLSAEDVKMTPDSRGFLTYYSVNGVNYDPPPLPSVDVLEVPYLGAVMLQAARLPLRSPSRSVCASCRSATAATTHARKLMKSWPFIGGSWIPASSTHANPRLIVGDEAPASPLPTFVACGTLSGAAQSSKKPAHS